MSLSRVDGFFSTVACLLVFASAFCYNSGAQLGGRKVGRFPLPFFENRKCALILEKKNLILSIFELNFYSRYSFKIIQEKKLPGFSRRSFLFLRFFFFNKIFIKLPRFHETSPVLKNFCLHPCNLTKLQNYSLCESQIKSFESLIKSFEVLKNGKKNNSNNNNSSKKKK